jgi:hypothetical protein
LPDRTERVMGRHSDAPLARAVNVALAPNYSQKSRAVFETVPDFKRPSSSGRVFPVPPTADYRGVRREGNSLTSGSSRRSRATSRSRLPSRSVPPPIAKMMRRCTKSKPVDGPSGVDIPATISAACRPLRRRSYRDDSDAGDDKNGLGERRGRRGELRCRALSRGGRRRRT